MLLDFSSSIDIHKIYLIMDILVILMIGYIYYIVFKYYNNIFNISAIDYIRNTVSRLMIKLPIKWFDWIKFAIIIATLSAINIIYNDKYILLIIYISYIALFFDFYYFIYDFTSIAIQKPAEDSLNKSIVDLEVPLVDLILEIIKYLNGNPEEICGEERPDNIKYIKSSMLEDFTQYRPTSALTKKDVLDRKLKNIIDEIIGNIERMKNLKLYIIYSLKGAMAAFAFILTIEFYRLINHFLSLYTSYKPT